MIYILKNVILNLCEIENFELNSTLLLKIIMLQSITNLSMAKQMHGLNGHSELYTLL